MRTQSTEAAFRKELAKIDSTPQSQHAKLFGITNEYKNRHNTALPPFEAAKTANYIDVASWHIAELYPEIVYGKPAIMNLPPGAIIGTWTYSIRGKMRFVLERDRELAPGVMPADVSRAWIRTEYTLPFRRRKPQLERGFVVPLHASVGKHGYCFYIDLNKAYAQILAMGYDLEYLQGKYIGATPVPLPPEILANKLCYSIAVTMSGNSLSDIETMGKEGVFHRKSMNQYSNPCLYNLANDTLNGIGAEMLAVLKDKCVYVNTDGYIIREGFEKYAFDIIESWGFKASIKMINDELVQGETEVRGVGSWKIGKHHTKRFDPYAQDFTGALMAQDERRWLKTRWSIWNARV